MDMFGRGQLWSLSNSLRPVGLLVPILWWVCFRLVSTKLPLLLLPSHIRTWPFHCLLEAKLYPRSQSWQQESIWLCFGQVASQGYRSYHLNMLPEPVLMKRRVIRKTKQQVGEVSVGESPASWSQWPCQAQSENTTHQLALLFLLNSENPAEIVGFFCSSDLVLFIPAFST